MIGNSFREVRCHYKTADLRLGTVDDAMAYYRSLVYFKEAFKAEFRETISSRKCETTWPMLWPIRDNTAAIRAASR
jgi:hypothetical protein